MERVVGPLRIQTDFGVVVSASMAFQNLFDPMAEVSFDFEHEASEPSIGLHCLIAEQLVGERIHAAARLSATDRADDHRSGEQSTFRDRQPGWSFGRYRRARIV